MTKITKYLQIIIGVFLAASLLAGCSADSSWGSEGLPQSFRAENFEGKTIGVLTGTVFDQLVREHIPGAAPAHYNHDGDVIQAMRSGKADAILTDDAILRLLAAKNPGLVLLEPFVTQDEYGVIAALENKELIRNLNDFIARIKSDGTYDDMITRWLDTAEPSAMPDIPEGKNGTLMFGTNGVLEGFTYYHGEELVGFDVEFAKRFASYMDMELKTSVMEFSSIIPAIASGKIDFAANSITITDERKKSVSFTDPYYVGGAAIGVFTNLSQQNLSEEMFTERLAGLFNNLGDSITRTFITESRWRLVLSGLRITIVISVLSMILGTLLGALICAMRRNRNRFLSGVANIYIRIIQGTPIVLMLMILYYIIFGGVNIDAVIVAVIGFSLNFAAYTSEMFRTGIDAVDKGQLEAAAAGGFSKPQSFLLITLPQAARHIIPVYKGEFISMVKTTSVVGYIAIQDLTKASDIIRSRTYEAFFPLIVTALIYFTLTYIFIAVLNQVELRIDPKRRKRMIKGGRAE